MTLKNMLKAIECKFKQTSLFNPPRIFNKYFIIKILKIPKSSTIKTKIIDKKKIRLFYKY